MPATSRALSINGGETKGNKMDDAMIGFMLLMLIPILAVGSEVYQDRMIKATCLESGIEYTRQPIISMCRRPN